jgi:hypothetical protein
MSGINMLFRKVPLNIMMGMKCGNRKTRTDEQNKKQAKICKKLSYHPRELI